MDHYQTRIGEEEIVDRLCLVEASPLGGGYAERGFTVIRDVIAPSDIERMQQFADGAWGGGYYVSPEPETGDPRSVLGFDQQFEWFTRSPYMTGIASAVLGSDWYIHQSRVNYKRGTKANGWKWHSDFETWHHCDGMPAMRCFTAMIPLQANTAFNGPLTVIQGSHLKYVRCAGNGDVTPEGEFSEQTSGLPSDEAITALSDEGKNYRQIIANPGDLVIFDCNILHGSTASLDPRGRANMFFVFNSVDNRLINPTRPEAMARR